MASPDESQGEASPGGPEAPSPASGLSRSLHRQVLPQELSRRGILRALVAWTLASFAMLQVAEPLMHGLGLPEWTLRAVVVFLGLGFPATILLAWVHGLKITGAELTPPAVSASSPLLPAALILPLVAGAAGLGATLSWLALRGAGSMPRTEADGRTFVAVADFANETRDQDLDALSGLLITSLEQSRRLRVMSRGGCSRFSRSSARGAGRSPTRICRSWPRRGRSAGESTAGPRSRWAGVEMLPELPRPAQQEDHRPGAGARALISC